MKDKFNNRPTGWPTTQDKIYKQNEWILIGRIISEYKPETKRKRPIKPNYFKELR